MYELFKTLHVLSAAAWVGGALLLVVMERMVHRAQEPAAVVALAGLGERTGNRFFAPVAGVVLLSGLGTVLAGGYGFEEPWIVAGIVGVISGSVLGARVLSPLYAQIQEAAASGDEAGLAALRSRLTLWSAFDLSVLVVIVVLMVTRPNL